MNKKSSLLVACILAAPSAFAGIVVDGNLADWGIHRNGLASDWTPNSGIHYVVEDQTGGTGVRLFPGYGGQAYDTEAMYATIQDGRLYIALATGHNPRTVNNPSGNSYGAGDFAIDFGKDGRYELGINIQFATGPTSVESFGITGGAYVNPTWAYGLWDASGNQTSTNPDRLHPTSLTGGTRIGNATLAYTTVGANNYGQYRSDLHYFYELSLSTSLLAAAGWDGHSAFNIQWTENCANDSIIVDPAITVPEPGTLALLSLGLVGVVGARRRRKPD